MTRAFAVLMITALAVQACQEQPGSSPADKTPSTPNTSAADAPVRVEYVCDNRFLLINAHKTNVPVKFRVQGTDEQGQRTLPPAFDGDPAFSEIELTTANRGSVELYVNGELVQVQANDGSECGPPSDGPAPSFAVAGAPSAAGQWSAVQTWPIVPVHLSMMRNGKLLTWGKAGVPYVWNPANNTFASVPAPSWLFCAGHAMLPDGRVFVAGGHIADDRGLPDLNIFNPATSSWTSAPPMRWGRWYPTTTLMPNGEVVTIAGRDQRGAHVRTPEVWTGSSWRSLTTAVLTLPYYPRMFLAPNGKLFYAGEERTTRYLDPTGTGKWDTLGKRVYGGRDYGAAVMYEPGKILYVGGGRTTNTAEMIDLNQASPVWKWTGSMATPRRHHNATILPTGDVLVTGGTSGTAFNDVTKGVHTSELWSPATGKWTTLASNTVTRPYHGTSILLPDGRVVHAGGGDAALEDGTQAPAQNNAEIFSPPYLFKGARPKINSGPSVLDYTEVFTVGTSTPADIIDVTWIALGSTTHAIDMSQRFMRLPFTRTGTGLSVTAPMDKITAPPGYYMLFVINKNKVPSVARIIRLQ